MTKYRRCRSCITPHACLVYPQTYKVFVAMRHPTYVLPGEGNWRLSMRWKQPLFLATPKLRAGHILED